MNVLYVITGLGMGGAERQVCDLADEMATLGQSVRLVALNSKNEAKIFPKNQSITVDFLEMSKSPFGLFKAILALKNIIRDFQPDVVHCHMFHANIIGRISRLFVKFPKLICTAHSSNEGGSLRMLAYRYSNFLSDFNTNVSEEAVQAFIGRQAVKKDRMFAMPNGIDTHRFYKNEGKREELRNELGLDNNFVFLAVGRLEKPKDYPNLLKAFQLVHQQYLNTKLVIVGAGSLELELKELSNTLGISSKVLFLGLRKDIPEIMNIADTYVLSSQYEGFGIVIAEAMLTENVVVATDCGGVKDVLGGFGYLVEPKDYLGLSEVMIKSLTLLPQERIQIGTNARSYIVANYSLREIAKKWLTLYQGK